MTVMQIVASLISSLQIMQLKSRSTAATREFSTSRVCDEQVWRVPRFFLCIFTKSAVRHSFSTKLERRLTAASRGRREKEDLKPSKA